jgi:hypothetical protein
MAEADLEELDDPHMPELVEPEDEEESDDEAEETHPLCRSARQDRSVADARGQDPSLYPDYSGGAFLIHGTY